MASLPIPISELTATDSETTELLPPDAAEPALQRSASLLSSARSIPSVHDEEEEEDQVCRICGTCSDYGALVRVCSCRSYVHVECQLEWGRVRSERFASASICEVCGSPIQIDHYSYSYSYTSLFERLSTLEGCATILLLAVACCVHTLYFAALVSRRPVLVLVLGPVNAFITGLLFGFALIAGSRIIRHTPPLKLVVFAGAIGSIAAGVLVYLIASVRFDPETLLV